MTVAALCAVFILHPKAVPVYGESGCECNEQSKGERFKAAKCREMFPLSLTSFDSSPRRRWRLLALYAGLNTVLQAVPVYGESGHERSEWPKGE